MKGDKKMVKETTDSAKVNLVDVLKEIRGGDFLFEASGDLEKVIAGVRETCKPGKLVLTLKIKPLSKGDVSSVRIRVNRVLRMIHDGKHGQGFWSIRNVIAVAGWILFLWAMVSR